MIPIVCIDNQKGMMFNHRRQSKDENLRKNLLEEVVPGKLLMNEFSLKQFGSEDYKRITVCNDFLEKAETGDYCFVENQLLYDYISRIEKIVIYNWNRIYPADFYFDIDISQLCWIKVEVSEFKGKSHPKIIREVYIREK